MVNPFRRSKSPARKTRKVSGYAVEDTGPMAKPTPSGVNASNNRVASGLRSVSPSKLNRGSRYGKDNSHSPIIGEKENKDVVDEDGDDEVTALPSMQLKTVERSAAAEQQMVSSNAFYQRLLKVKDSSEHDSNTNNDTECMPAFGEAPPEMVSWVELKFRESIHQITIV